MTKLVSALLLTAATIAAPAFAGPVSQPIAFERSGIHYVASITDRADGSRLIAGHEVESGHAFELLVAGGIVQGTYDHQLVSYDVPRAKSAKRNAADFAVASNAGM